MIYDKAVMKAVSKIRQRSERQSDLGKIDRTFVDPGIIDDINNENHQVLFGRRGTGKTHVLRMLQSVLTADKETMPIFIDTRVLGSTSQYSDLTISLKQRSLFLFKDILNEIYSALLSSIIEDPPEDSDQALEDLDAFLSAFSERIEDVARYSITTTKEGVEGSHTDFGVTGSLKGGLSFEAKATGSTKAREEITKHYDVDVAEKIVFPKLSQCLSHVLDSSQLRLVLLIDEWSSLPLDVQPYLAEFIKRSILPCNRVVVKIAALEYRSLFGVYDNQRYTGFELGADVATAQDLDSFYVFETDPQKLESDFAEMLLRHISSELPAGYLDKRYHVYDGETLMDKIFEEGAFNTLALSAEGVIRDLINIFTIAFAKVHRPKGYEKRTKITRRVVLESVRQWFEHDKFQNLPHELQVRYQLLLSELLGKLKSRYFLVSIDETDVRTLKQLVDLRIVHLAKKTFMSVANPGAIYNMYNIDFGSYASIMDIAAHSKHDSPEFFDRESFSQLPGYDADVSKYLVSIHLIQ